MFDSFDSWWDALGRRDEAVLYYGKDWMNKGDKSSDFVWQIEHVLVRTHLIAEPQDRRSSSPIYV